MQERHDNDKIKPHNHNEYPLLYKEAELLTSVLGRFLECRKWNILVITWALGIFLIYMPAPSGLQPSGLGIYIRQIPLAHGITITYHSCKIINLLRDICICLWVLFLGLKFNKFLGDYLRDGSLIMSKKLSINGILADIVPESI